MTTSQHQPMPMNNRRMRLLLSLLTVSISSTDSFVSLVPISSAPRPRLATTHLAAYRDDDNSSSGPCAVHVPTNAASSLAKKPPSSLPNGGRITLLGAGPGDPDLLTVKAHRLLSDEKSLVIVDRLVSDEILGVVKGELKRANKYPGCAEQAQNEIYEWCKQGLREGRHVVRLKIGDPFVFGRGGEEVIEFRKCGVEPAVIPGVSAAFSAPLLASIPVTHRGVSNQVVMCTGYGRNNTSPDLIQYHKEQTVVFLMAVGRLRELCDKLVTMASYPVQTPVGIVERAGCPDQRTVVGTMQTIADLAEKYNVKPPSTVVVGDVVNVLLTEGDFVGDMIGANVIQVQQ